jgi:hypothetical protein
MDNRWLFSIVNSYHMKRTNILGASLGLLVIASGCGKSDDTSLAPPPPAPKQQDAAVVTPPPVTPPAPTPTAPPPAGGAAAAAPAAPEAEPKEIKTIDGKTISALQYLQSLADAYNRTRAGQSDGTPWPELTDLQLLVNVGMVKRLPSPPAGQKFVFDAKTGKVTLSP